MQYKSSFALYITPLMLCLAGAPVRTLAADLPDTKSPPLAPIPDTSWWSTITHTEQLEGGIAVNPDNPGDHKNFGQLFTDISNQPVFNQLLITVTRPTDPNAKGYDVGFDLQGLFGSDARYDPTLGIFDSTLKGRYQFVMTNANLLVHTPWLTPGGIDFKLGLYPGAMGYETTDPSTRPFYTLSYVSNFLLPFENVGALATWHVNPTLDVWAGIDTGNEVTFGPKDNNSEPAGYFGIGLNNLLDNKLTVLGMTRFGPEDSLRVFPNANSLMRSWNDVTVTYKATDKLTFVGEANYIHDDALGAAYGFDGYLSYQFNSQVTFNLRGEVLRDTTGLWITGFETNTGFTSAIAGYSDVFVNAPPTTYGDITAGVTYKPDVLNTKLYRVSIRPEIRYDTSLNGTQPFDMLSKSNQFLFSTDVIVAF